jgi:hypothetical protein
MAQLKVLWEKLIATKEPTFVLTIAVAGLTWSLTQIVDRITAEPLVTYTDNSAFDTKSGKFVIKYFVNNISRDHGFQDVHFSISTGGDSDMSFTNEAFAVNPPIIGNDWRPDMDKDAFTLDIPELPPGGKFQMTLMSNKKVIPPLRFKHNFSTAAATDPLLLEESGPATCLASHYDGVLIGLTVAWVVLLFLFLRASA